MSFNDFKISRKIAASFALILLVVGITNGAIYLKITTVDQAGAMNSQSSDLLNSIDNMLEAETQSVITATLYAMKATDSGAAQYDARVKDGTDAVSAMQKRLIGYSKEAEITALVKQMASAFSAWQSEIGDAVVHPGQPTSAAVKMDLMKSDKSLALKDAFIQAASESKKQINAWSDDDQATQDGAIASAKLAQIIGMALALFAAVLIGWWLARLIAGPVVNIAGAMKRLAMGDHTIAIPARGRKDEIGQMAAAVQTFKDAAIEKVRLESEAADTRRLIDEERARNEAERAKSTRQQTAALAAIASGLERLSDGELIFRIDEAFVAEYEKLRSDFNGAMDKLQETMRVVSGNTVAIRSGTSEISSAADDLSRRTEQQAASLEQTAAALDEITATVRKTAEGSKHARAVVGQAKNDAEHSGQVVREAVEAMNGIEKSANQISQIIGVIDEIAFQTNLLALNAGVEAARAGDAGRGFAVVASEVRALAQRSADAAKEIKTLISASSSQVERGVDLVGQTGKALDRILLQITEINVIVVDIAASAQEQATGLDQVNTAVNQMDQVTQQNAAMVEESTAASHALARETEELSRLIGGFQLGQVQQAYGGVGTSQRGVSPSKPMARKKPVAAMRTTGSGGAARKAEPAGDWQEF